MTPVAIRPTRSLLPITKHALDTLLICGSLPIAQWLLGVPVAVSLPMAHGSPVADSVLALGLSASLTMFFLGECFGVYRPSRGRSADTEVGLLTAAWSLTALAVAVLVTMTGSLGTHSSVVLISWFFMAGLLVICGHMGIRAVMEASSRAGYFVRRTAIVGANRLGLEIARSALQASDCGMKVVGVYDDRGGQRLEQFENHPAAFLGSTEDLLQSIQRDELDTVLIALPMRAEKRIQQLLDTLANSTVSVYIVPDFFVFELLHSRWTHVGGLPVVSVFESPIYGVDGWLKRCIDIALAVVGLLLVSPILLVCGLLIRCTSAGPVFFKQKRYGLDGKEILVWKFRTMFTCDNGAVVKQATKDDPRVTPIGRILRRTSLDELPQLFNVLFGNMSLVGPRPHATAHNEQFRSLIRGYMMRHKVKPGITGLAQVFGSRGETDTLEKMEHRIALDHRYLREWSLWLDLRILLRTIRVVLKQDAY